MRSLSMREHTSLDRSPMKVSAVNVGVMGVRLPGSGHYRGGVDECPDRGDKEHLSRSC